MRFGSDVLWFELHEIAATSARDTKISVSLADAVEAGIWYSGRQMESGFFAHYRDAIGRHIAKYGTHEPLVTQWLNNYLNVAAPGIVVDVGANLGWHTLHAAQHR